MASIRLSTVMVQSSHHYTGQVSGYVTVRDIARYISQIEARIETSTLEVGRPVELRQRLRDLDIQSGDRLLIFSQSPRPVDLPAPLRPGDKILKFRLGDFELNSHGKRALLLGKPDEAQQIIPDIDLRYFIPPKYVEFISRSCLWLTFDEYTRAWYASRAGQTRITLDELELGGDRVALNEEQWLRFYRGSDDPAHPASRPLAEIQVRVETVQSRGEIIQMPSGGEPLNLRVGLEKESQLINASENVSLEQVATGLVRHHGAPMNRDVSVYLMRLVSPQLELHTLHLGEDTFLYAAMSVHYARNVLLLHDIYQRDRVYVLTAGWQDDEKLIGCRSQADASSADLDVDLYDSVTAQGFDPRPFYAQSPYYARLAYRSAEQTWWIRLDERTHVPLFVNNARASSSTAVQLTSGDVLSFGPSVGDYYARLEVEITSKSG